ncbi:MAG: laccase domain-containing protein [Nitrospiraceae bacterium]
MLARLREKPSPTGETVVRPVGNAKAHLNLRDFVRRQVMADGLRAEQVTTVNACTICHPDLFCNYRREGRQGDDGQRDRADGAAIAVA